MGSGSSSSGNPNTKNGDIGNLLKKARKGEVRPNATKSNHSAANHQATVDRLHSGQPRLAAQDDVPNIDQARMKRDIKKKTKIVQKKSAIVELPPAPSGILSKKSSFVVDNRNNNHEARGACESSLGGGNNGIGYNTGFNNAFQDHVPGMPEVVANSSLSHSSDDEYEGRNEGVEACSDSTCYTTNNYLRQNSWNNGSGNISVASLRNDESDSHASPTLVKCVSFGGNVDFNQSCINHSRRARRNGKKKRQGS
ncbi:hypothetical protein ERJ75_001466400 [Trypanosoma vivax]|uniref:Uncharacterized protein n=1 Tax=Trypanosoma vivax (strain Y486) TaxID=1055687 RepID=G0TVQ6_TRYVY|nr:hypothetical protein ERJ75_001466400 [Trypanosoma vivax]CCC48022.1 hypothetical protein TVY486_0502264 [Trypanosoma vivax Y486]